MHYCSHCGSSNLSFTIPPGDNRPRYHCNDCQTIHYQNPKVVAGCLPIWEDKVLLCRRDIPEPLPGLNST
ncbi:MAG: NUDIX hydrolase, partial [Bacteroidota bacterium]